MTYYNVAEAAQFIGVSQSFLNKRRVYGGGPLFIKVGKRVVYHSQHLESWMLARSIANTSQTTSEAQ